MKTIMIKLTVVVLSLSLLMFANNGCTKPAPEPASKPAASSVAAPPIQWKLLSSWGTDMLWTREFAVKWADRVTKLSGGRIAAKYVAGPESVPALKQLEATKTGVYDAWYTHIAYSAGEIGVGQILDLVWASPAEKRQMGLYAALNEYTEKKANIELLGSNAGFPFSLYVKKKLDKADLTGLKIRTTPFYEPLIKALGGASVNTAPAEIYASLQTGVVDGITWPSLEVLTTKYYEVVKYIVLPDFGDNAEVMFVNLDSWKKLPKDLQDIVMKAEVEVETESYPVLNKAYVDERQELTRRGMELISLPPAEQQKFLETFWNASWNQSANWDPATSAKMKQIAENWRAKNGLKYGGAIAK